MSELAGSVVSVHSGDHVDLHKEEQPEVQAQLDGFVGDKHRGYSRVAFAGDIDPVGTVRRNERQWSAVSIEELEVVAQRMDLREPLAASTLGANLCFQDIPDLSGLLRGTRLHFPSGAVLRVEECNPPWRRDGGPNCRRLHHPRRWSGGRRHVSQTRAEPARRGRGGRRARPHQGG